VHLKYAEGERQSNLNLKQEKLMLKKDSHYKKITALEQGNVISFSCKGSLLDYRPSLPRI
jgi:hypothetical protein